MFAEHVSLSRYVTSACPQTSWWHVFSDLFFADAVECAGTEKLVRA